MERTDDNERFPSRKHPRLKNFDYSSPNYYFITICTWNKNCIFGKPNELNQWGNIAENDLLEIEHHFSGVKIDKYVVMPNHVHAILRISLRDGEADNAQRSSLGIVIGGLKREVKLFAKRRCLQFAWHTRYHDHIIRGATDGNNIANYIRTNVERWGEDCFNRMEG